MNFNVGDIVRTTETGSVTFTIIEKHRVRRHITQPTLVRYIEEDVYLLKFNNDLYQERYGNIERVGSLLILADKPKEVKEISIDKYIKLKKNKYI